MLHAAGLRCAAKLALCKVAAACIAVGCTKGYVDFENKGRSLRIVKRSCQVSCCVVRPLDRDGRQGRIPRAIWTILRCIQCWVAPQRGHFTTPLLLASR